MCDRVVNTPLTFITISDTLQNVAKKVPSSTVSASYLPVCRQKIVLAYWLVPSSLEPNVHHRFASLFSTLHLLISSDIFSKFFSQNSFSVYNYHCVKSDRICSFSGAYFLRIPSYSVRMRENTDQKNSEYGHFSRSVYSSASELIYLAFCGYTSLNLPVNHQQYRHWFLWKRNKCQSEAYSDPSQTSKMERLCENTERFLVNAPVTSIAWNTDHWKTHLFIVNWI